jgi:molybdate transport system permease protein
MGALFRGLGRFLWRRRFGLVLLLSVVVSTSLMLLLLVAQVVYTGGGEPLTALGDHDVRHAMFLSFSTATVASVIGLTLAIPTGFALSRSRVPGLWLVEALLLIPVIMSPMALGVALLLVFRTGPGMWVEDNLVRFVFEVPGLVLAQLFVAYAFAVLVLRTTFAGISVRLEQVARFLGCTRWQAFRRVSLPLARNGIIAAFVLGWARALGDFGATCMVAGAVKGKTETMPVSIYLNMATAGVDRAVALSLVLTSVTVVGLVAVRLLLGKERQA